MFYWEHTCTTPAEDLALDEALLEQAEQGTEPHEVLRLWEPRRPMVVLGRSSQFSIEANAEECRRRDVAIVRRSSGGAAIVTGPGCLMYSVVLSYALRPALRSIDEAHRCVLETVLTAIRPHVPDAVRRGTSDLAVGERKFSGNSLRCRREHLLYHGTLLYDFPLDLIPACLGTPPRQPDYRAGRPHEAFVMNLPCSRASLIDGLRKAWDAMEPLPSPPQELVQELADAKYRQSTWTEQLP